MAKYKVFAAIDLGSTGITMKIAEISKRYGINVLDTVKYDISLGKESYTIGKISYSLVDKICGCFEEYLRIMKSYGVDDYVCYATTAVREASNSEYIIDQINIRTGIKVNIISNQEERFLHYKAFALSDKKFDDIIEEGAVIADVSSGSVQVSYYTNSSLKFSENIPIGSLRVLEILSNDNNTVSSLDMLEDYIKSFVNNYKKVFFKNPSYNYFVAIGNQNDYIKKICGKENLCAKDFDIVYDKILTEGINNICEKYEIPYEAASLINPSILFYKMFLESEKKISMPSISLADGILVEYVEKNAYTHTRHIFTDDIISSSKYYAGKYSVSSKHYDKVMEIGESLYGTLAKKFGLSKRHLVLLKVATIFADTGYYININDYNRHSYDIIKANPILGLSQKEHEIISSVVLFQNGIFNYETYNRYSKNRKLLISKLSAILSLSKALDVEYNQKVEKVTSSIKNGNLIINAYSNSDIALENREFNISADFFEEVFGIKAVLVKKGLK